MTKKNQQNETTQLYSSKKKNEREFLLPVKKKQRLTIKHKKSQMRKVNKFKKLIKY